MERAATTASSLDAEQDSGSGPKCQDTILGGVDAQTRFETTSKQSNDPLLSRGYTLKSGEDSMKILELMELCTKLSDLIWQLMFTYVVCISCIHRFRIRLSKTVNGDVRIQALVDRKKIIVHEASIRCDLKLEDAELEEKKSRSHRFRRLYKVGSSRRIKSSKESLGTQEDASKQGRKIADLDADAEVTLVDETQGGNDADMMFDICVLEVIKVVVETRR
ncbi:hypothetical protein Tco_1174536 [Tanacetum coccineum]